MLTTILSQAGGGKSYLTIRKALEAAKDKRLLILTYEMSTTQILKRVDACLDYLDIKAPKKITVQEKDLNNVITPILFDEVLNELLAQYDVIALDGYFLNRLHSSLNLDAQDTNQILKKCLTDTLRHNPDKQIIINKNILRPFNSGDWTPEYIKEVGDDFFNLELNTEVEDNILIIKTSINRFQTFEFNEKKHNNYTSEEFLFGMNKK